MAKKKSRSPKKWAITLRREEISEHTLELVIEAPTLRLALKAAMERALKAKAGDLEWQLDDYRWANGPPTVEKHNKAGDNDEADFVVDAQGNLVAGGEPATPDFRPAGVRIARDND